MRYAPPGLCMNDFDLIKLEDKYHLIHLQGPPIYPFDATYLESSYGHAVSNDLISWETKAPVFGIAPPDHFDDSGIWTMHITPYENKLWMFYTGLSYQKYFYQQIGLAISELENSPNWMRYKSEPLVSADPRYYQVDDDMAWRDPFVIFDPEENKWIMYIAAKTKKGDKRTRGCIGTATSKNLVDWKVKPPVISPEKYFEMECPVIFRHNNSNYMFVSISDDRRVHAYRAATPLGQFEYLGPLTPQNNYAARIINAGNTPLLLHTVPRRWQHKDSGELMRGMLAQPKKLLFDKKGYPYLGWYSALEEYFLKEESPSGSNGLLTVQLPPHYSEIEIGLRLSHRNSQRTGLELLVNENYLTLQYFEDKQQLESIKLESKISFKEIKILLFGEYVEIYCDNKLFISTLSYRHHTGNFEANNNNKAIDFTFRPYDKKKNPTKRDDLNILV
jgi:sucrose-6-phosphate hydrolase SacC (GH32 family)